MTQESAFDKYDHLLDLKPTASVVCNTPIVSMQLHRLAYFTRNEKLQKANDLVILPYLHERRIYLNKMKPDCKYFYTSIRESVANGGDEQDDQADFAYYSS